jgi:EmrB/QacA subfamily drug resistance transporter
MFRSEGEDMSRTMKDPPALDRRSTAGLLALSLGVALIVIDMSIVNLILPQMARDLDLGFSGLQYVSALFSLAAAAVTIAAGDVADRVGHRNAYLGGLAVFLVGSAAAALAPNAAVMLVARVTQGIGGGVVMTAALGTINATYSGSARGMAFGLYGMTFAVSGAIGPLLGAVLAEAVNWRWAFWVNLALGPVALVGVIKLIPAIAADAVTRRADVLGTVLVSAAITTLTYALVQGAELALVPAAVLFAAFVFVQRSKIRRALPVILDPALMRVRSFTVGSIALMIVGVGEFGLLFLLPLELQAGEGLSAIQAGLVLLPVSIGAFLAFPLVQALAARRGAHAAVQVGLVFEAVGLVGVAVAVSSTDPLWLIPGLAVYGLGVGAAAAQLSAIVLADVPAAYNGLASGVSSAARGLGGSLGVALLGLAFTTSLAGTSDALADRPVQTVSTLRGQGQDELVARAGDALAPGIAAAALVAAAFLIIGALVLRAQPRSSAGTYEAAPVAA